MLLAYLQYRQQPAGQAHALISRYSSSVSEEGAARPSSDAAWRRAGDFADVDELHKSVGYKHRLRSKSASSDLRSGIKLFIAIRVIVILETMCVSNDTAALFRDDAQQRALFAASESRSRRVEVRVVIGVDGTIKRTHVKTSSSYRYWMNRRSTW